MQKASSEEIIMKFLVGPSSEAKAKWMNMQLQRLKQTDFLRTNNGSYNIVADEKKVFL